ncbi:MAG: hypothetical protein IJ463_02420 [Bacilli bacterium]|nr:hypothetical protein [Bacilli bacterium]
MKKIFKLFILVFVCLLPVMVDAKANFEFDKEFNQLIFLYEEDGNSYYMNESAIDLDEEGSLIVFDSNNNLIEESVLIPPEGENNIDNRSFIEFYKTYLPIREYLTLYEYDNKLFLASFLNGGFDVFDLETSATSGFAFEEDLSLTKKVLGKSFDLYTYLLDNNHEIGFINEYAGYFVVEYYNSDSERPFISVFDSQFEEILKFETEYKNDVTIYIYDKLIYVMENNEQLDLYKLDGTKIQTLRVSHSLIGENMHGEDCTYIDPVDINIINNNLYITYFSTSGGCGKRLTLTDVEEYSKTISIPTTFTLKYNIDFDVETVSSSDGEFTYEEVVSDDGKSYVELKVTPKDGYSVEEIIVTDINGDRIEVTNNKFLKPLHDVKVEVKYVKGEYLPIPDTFLGKSVSLIIIGLILVGLGTYTINYVKNY